MRKLSPLAAYAIAFGMTLAMSVFVAKALRPPLLTVRTLPEVAIVALIPFAILTLAQKWLPARKPDDH